MITRLHILFFALYICIVSPFNAAALATVATVPTNDKFPVNNVPVNRVTQDSTFPVAPDFQVYQDNDNELSLATIDSLSDDKWQNMTPEKASFGFTESPFWIRTRIHNQSDKVENFIIELDYPLLDSVLFQVQIPRTETFSIKTGDTLPFYPRHVDNPGNLMRFQLLPLQQAMIYIRVQTQGSVLLPLQLWQEKHYFEAASAEQKVHFFYYGAVSVIILINLAVFFTLRERLYLYYALAIAGYLVFFATSRGYIHQLFIPGLPDLNSRLFLTSMPVLALFSVLFARQFLKTSEHSPKLDFALKGMVLFECCNLTLALVADYDLVVRVSALGAVLLFTVLFTAGPVTYSSRKRAGLYFTIAWTPLTVGFFAASGRTSGFLPNTFLTEYAMQIGSGIEAVILTLALADRLYHEREKKIEAQEDSLRVEKQRSQAQSQLADVMSKDPVTLLSNRNRFEWMVSNTISANPDKRYILAVARVTRLEEITRTLGLSSVETILRKVAKVLNEEHCAMAGNNCQHNEQGEKEGVYQLSRETFGIFMEQKAFEENPDDFYAALKLVAEPIDFRGLSIDLSPVFGCALYPKHGTEPAQLIKNALIAMKDSHHARGMMGIFHESMDIYDERRLTLITELKDALENNGLELFYQPKLNINNQQVVGLEGLARWIHPQRGFIPPDEFITLAEEAGLIYKLTLWAFEQAVGDLKLLRERGYQGSVSVNISARDLFERNLCEDLQDILTKHGMNADAVYLELTETGAMEDPEAGIATLNRLSNLGLKIAIDDFGTGYSSLSYLQRLPASEIKLDRSLVKDICSCESTAIIVKTSIDMIHALGYRLVAEGIEDESTVHKLQEYQCDSVQGFFYCKPKPLSEITDWLASR